ncbi:MAG: heavy-metal-associated domain-containing protein [Lachnospiraceae bacterium]|nr:heavy-metal-associated domain-containing protein [Lachnospiraceae bacterium]
MTDGIIIAILVVALFFGIRATVKHFARKGGCCGSADYKPKKKKLSKVLYQKNFKVEGMHCEHCKARVEEVVNDIQGLSGSVNLKKGILTVSYAEDVDDELIKSKIERVGYKVVL